MATIGTIKSIALEGEYIVAAVETGAGPEVTGVVMGSAGAEFFPVVGDVVLFERTGKEIAVLATLTVAQGDPGGVIIRGRDETGAVVSLVMMSVDGSVKIQNDNGFFEISANGQASVNGNFTVDP
jgi:hypothetical protein